MTRRHFTFSCAGETLAATLDEAAGKVGLLIVSGGNETRAGAFAGQAQLAATVAAAGYPVLRFDRRGVGDSSGDNAGFRGEAEDIAAALAAFRQQQPQVRRVVAFSNCDAASAVLLAGGAGCDALALANPWTFDEAQGESDSGPDAQSIRRRYLAKLRNPREVWRLVTGGVSLTKLAGGLAKAAGPAAASGLAADMARAIAGYPGPVRYLLAANDRTAQAFMHAWPQSVGRWQVCDDAGHSFAEDHTKMWLFKQLLALLDEQTGQLDMG
ncbi:MAG: hydrolase 1, exosortase A system-associated [Alteraurantiacibacter sp.]